MLYESDQDNQYLEHYGVPGQKWGVITKEYQKVGYDHRYDHTQFKNRQSQAITKMKRRKMAQEYERRRNYELAYRNGQRVGENFFYKARYNERKRQQEEARRRNPKPDFIRRTVDKVADQFGLKEYSEMASDFIKDQAKNAAMSYLAKNANKGPVQVAGTKLLGKILGKPIGVAAKPIAKGAEIVSKALQPKNAIKNGARFIGKTAKVVAWDTPKTIGKGFKWLENGGYKMIKSHAAKIRAGAHTIAKHARVSAKFLAGVSSTARKAGTYAASKAVVTGRKFIQAGSKMMIKLLSKIRS